MAYAPAGSAGFFRDILPERIGLLETVAPSFGDCLFHAAATLLEAGHDAVCLLNSDSPTLPTAYLVGRRDGARGSGDRIVLGPSTDGGYYLIGLKRPHRRLFEDIDWSTERVIGPDAGAGARAGPCRCTSCRPGTTSTMPTRCACWSASCSRSALPGLGKPADAGRLDAARAPPAAGRAPIWRRSARRAPLDPASSHDGIAARQRSRCDGRICASRRLAAVALGALTAAGPSLHLAYGGWALMLIFAASGAGHSAGAAGWRTAPTSAAP